MQRVRRIARWLVGYRGWREAPGLVKIEVRGDAVALSVTQEGRHHRHDMTCLLTPKTALDMSRQLESASMQLTELAS